MKIIYNNSSDRIILLLLTNRNNRITESLEYIAKWLTCKILFLKFVTKWE